MQQPIESDEMKLLGNAPSMAGVRRFIDRAAPHALPVLLLGETGTGKELVARALATAGAGLPATWVALNCAGLDHQLVASELFGHERGAFTGAQGRHAGALERAAGGVLFLDEVGELPLAVQALLLRYLETGEIWRLGAEAPINVRCRLLAATHRDLTAAVTAGHFRADLYFRLHVLVLTLPPLRQRLDELPRLAIQLLQQDFPGRAIPLTSAALVRLRAHPWPGNVRELRHVLARAVIMGSGQQVTATDLSFAPLATLAPAPAAPPGELAQVQARAILAELRRQGGHLQRTALALGIARSTLNRRLRSL